MTRRLGAILLCFAVACGGGGGKKDGTTPKRVGKDADQSMKDTGEPDGSGVKSGSGSAGTGSGSDIATNAGSGAGSGSDTAPVDTTPPVTYPNLDPDPGAAKTQVDAHLLIAKNALAQANPDADGALKEARQALTFDAASVDAAAMIAFAYYHKRLYDTAELVLDDLFKRDAAKNNAMVFYVYGLVYDKTNRPEQAKLAFEKAVGLDPNYVSALTDLGVHQLMAGQYPDAQQTFERLTQQFKKTDAITMTSLGSAYRGRSADYQPGSNDRQSLVRSAEGAYKRATQSNANYGPAYYNLGLLYLENDPYPGINDPTTRINAAKGYFDQYKNMPGFDVKLYDERMKDVNKVLKRIEKQNKANKKKAKGGG